MNERRHITVEGIVQGVGFRPFVYGLAMKNGLAGFVFNDTAGVTIELEGEPPALENFLTHLREQPPPLARIENVDCRTIPLKGESAFNIVGSQGEEERSVLISPDTPTCDDCLEELFDPLIGAIAILLLTAPIAVPDSPSSKTFPTIASARPWDILRCAVIARANFMIPPIAAFMRSRMLARSAAREFVYSISVGTRAWTAIRYLMPRGCCGKVRSCQ